MSTWSRLTEAERSDIISRVRNGEDPDSLAIAHGLKPSSLRRQLRRMKPGKNTTHKLEFAQTGTNTAVATSKDKRVRTLEDLLEAADVDLDVWRVDRYLVNKWEVGAKARDQSIEWQNGVMSGYTEEHGLTIAPLYQVKAWLIRKTPVSIFPTIQPILCSTQEWAPRHPARKDGIGRALVWTDPHFGFVRDLRTHELKPMHDEAALSIILQIAKDIQPDRIDVLGDIFDAAELSDKFLRSPELTETMQPAVIAGHRWLRSFREACPDTNIRVHEGNHDQRLEDAIIKHLSAAYDLRPADQLDLPPSLSVPRLLALDALGIEWLGNYPNDEDWLNDGVRLAHGEVAQSVPGSTARASIEASDVTEVFGHCHRLELTSRVVRERGRERVITGFSVGCTCSTDGIVPSARSRVEWQKACAIIDYEIGGQWHSIYPVLIDRDRAIWDGRLYSGMKGN